jgi:hypothetical protein
LEALGCPEAAAGHPGFISRPQLGSLDTESSLGGSVQESTSVSPSIPAAAVGALLESAPHKSSDLSRLLWLGSVAIDGPIAATCADRVSLDALAAARIAAVAADTDPGFVDSLLRRATPVDDPADRAALHVAALRAIGRPAMARWMAANAADVASHPCWREMLPGLGGLTVSVPLAEEALHNMLRTRQKLPPELTVSLQLNPWYSARFAARYRRRMRGKRIRVRERAATSRGWSHARTIVSASLPAEWRSLHGRGVGRPLDPWSSTLLAGYVDLILVSFASGGVPAVVAPLLAVAAAVTPGAAVSEDAALPWAALPHEDEAAARRLVRLPPRPLDPLDRREVAGLHRACARHAGDLSGWRELGERFAATGTFET